MEMVNLHTGEIIQKDISKDFILEDLSIQFYIRCYHNSSDEGMKTRLFSRGEWQEDNKVVVQRLYQELLVTCITSKVR